MAAFVLHIVQYGNTSVVNKDAEATPTILFMIHPVRRLATSPVKHSKSSPDCESLIGLSLQSLDKRDDSWFFIFADGLSIVTESPWRFVTAEGICVTSEDHGHPFGLPAPVDAAARMLSGTAEQTILSAAIDPLIGDLTIEFTNQIYLQFLQLSCGYESWRFYAAGTQTICMGGGGTARFPNPNVP